jgi:hypothetical protein
VSIEMLNLKEFRNGCIIEVVVSQIFVEGLRKVTKILSQNGRDSNRGAPVEKNVVVVHTRRRCSIKCKVLSGRGSWDVQRN